MTTSSTPASPSAAVHPPAPTGHHPMHTVRRFLRWVSAHTAAVAASVFAFARTVRAWVRRCAEAADLSRLFRRAASPAVLPAVALATAVLVLTAVLWSGIPILLAAPQPLAPGDLADAQNSVRSAFTQCLIAIAAIAALYFTWRRVDIAEKSQITDRFAKAVELLNGKGIEVRLGGIYSLERLAQDSAKAPECPGPEYWTIMELLATYVRHRARWRSDKGQSVQGKKREMLDDVQAALTVLGRRKVLYKTDPDPRLHLSDTDLRGADLRGAHLEGARLHGAHLEDADLRGAHLRDANLVGAHFEGAALTDASGLTTAQLRDAYGDDDTMAPEHLKRVLKRATQPTTPLRAVSTAETSPAHLSPTTSSAPPETTSPPVE